MIVKPYFMLCYTIYSYLYYICSVEVLQNDKPVLIFQWFRHHVSDFLRFFLIFSKIFLDMDLVMIYFDLGSVVSPA